MPKKIQKLSLITVSIISLIIVSIFIVQKLKNNDITKTFALTEPNYAKMEENREPIETIIASYHEYMNDFFNQKTKLLEKSKLEDDVKEQANPTECPQNSIRTVCVAKEGNEILNKYLIALSEYKYTGALEQAKDEAAKSISTDQARLNEIELLIRLEQENAENSFEMALKLYDGYKRNLKVHNEYKKVIENLEKYRDKLIKIREPSDLLPAKFINVTTDKCT